MFLVGDPSPKKRGTTGGPNKGSGDPKILEVSPNRDVFPPPAPANWWDWWGFEPLVLLLGQWTPPNHQTTKPPIQVMLPERWSWGWMGEWGVELLVLHVWSPKKNKRKYVLPKTKRAPWLLSKVPNHTKPQIIWNLTFGASFLFHGTPV